MLHRWWGGFGHRFLIFSLISFFCSRTQPAKPSQTIVLLMSLNEFTTQGEMSLMMSMIFFVADCCIICFFELWHRFWFHVGTPFGIKLNVCRWVYIFYVLLHRLLTTKWFHKQRVVPPVSSLFFRTLVPYTMVNLQWSETISPLFFSTKQMSSALVPFNRVRSTSAPTPYEN